MKMRLLASAAACVSLVLALGSASAAQPQLVVSATAGSHDALLWLANPCAGDAFGGIVRQLSGPGATQAGTISVSTRAGMLMQATAWAGDGDQTSTTTVGCQSKALAGVYRLTVVAGMPVTLATYLTGKQGHLAPSTASPARLSSRALSGATAATSLREDIPVAPRKPTAVALFVFADYPYLHAASQPALCLHSVPGNCTADDGVLLIFPGTNTSVAASYGVQGYTGPGYASFEDEAVAVRLSKTDLVFRLSA